MKPELNIHKRPHHPLRDWLGGPKNITLGIVITTVIAVVMWFLAAHFFGLAGVAILALVCVIVCAFCVWEVFHDAD
jgi:hypothetical protein